MLDVEMNQPGGNIKEFYYKLVLKGSIYRHCEVCFFQQITESIHHLVELPDLSMFSASAQTLC